MKKLLSLLTSMTIITSSSVYTVSGVSSYHVATKSKSRALLNSAIFFSKSTSEFYKTQNLVLTSKFLDTQILIAETVLNTKDTTEEFKNASAQIWDALWQSQELLKTEWIDLAIEEANQSLSDAELLLLEISNSDINVPEGFTDKVEALIVSLEEAVDAKESRNDILGASALLKMSFNELERLWEELTEVNDKLEVEKNNLQALIDTANAYLLSIHEYDSNIISKLENQINEALSLVGTNDINQLDEVEKNIVTLNEALGNAKAEVALEFSTAKKDKIEEIATLIEEAQGHYLSRLAKALFDDLLFSITSDINELNSLKEIREYEYISQIDEAKDKADVLEEAFDQLLDDLKVEKIEEVKIAIQEAKIGFTTNVAKELFDKLLATLTIEINNFMFISEVKEYIYIPRIESAIEEAKLLEAEYLVNLEEAKTSMIEELTNEINDIKDNYNSSDAHLLYDDLLNSSINEINNFNEIDDVLGYRPDFENIKNEANGFEEVYVSELEKAKLEKISLITTEINDIKDKYITDEAKALFDNLLSLVINEINGFDLIEQINEYSYLDKLLEAQDSAKVIDDAYLLSLANAKELRIDEATFVFDEAISRYKTDEAKALLNELLALVTIEINDLNSIQRVLNYSYTSKLEDAKLKAQAIDDKYAFDLAKSKEDKISEMITLINNAKEEFKTDEAKALFDVLSKTMTDDINDLVSIDLVVNYDVVAKINSTKVEAEAIDDEYASDLAKTKLDKINEIIKIINNTKNDFNTNEAKALFDVLSNTITKDINGMDWIEDVASYSYADKLAQVKLEAQALDDAFAKELAEAKAKRINDVIVWIGDRTQFISDDARKLVSDFIESAINDINSFTTINQINNYLYQDRYKALEITANTLDSQLVNAKTDKITEMITLINNAKEEFKTDEAKALFDVLSKTMTDDINNLTSVDSVSKYDVVAKINSTKTEAEAIDNGYASDLAKAKLDKINEIIKVINNTKNDFNTNGAKALFDVLSNAITRDINALNWIEDVASYSYADKLAQVKLEAQALDDAFAKELAEAKAKRINDVIVWIGDRTQFISDEARKLVSDFIDSAISDINKFTTINQINNYLYQTRYEALEIIANTLDSQLVNAKADKITEMIALINNAKNEFKTNEAKALFDVLSNTMTEDINKLTSVNSVSSYEIISRINSTKIEAIAIDNQYDSDLSKAKLDKINEIIKEINNAKNGFSTNGAKALFDNLNNTITRDINGLDWIEDVTSYSYANKLAQVKLEAQALDDAFAKELAEAKAQRINDVIVWIGDRTQFISDDARKLVSDFIDSAISDINKFTTINQINNYLYQTRYRTLETTAIALDLELANAKSNKISEMIALINNAKNEFKTNEAKALFDVLNKAMTDDINSLTTVDSVSKYEIVSKINSTKIEAKAIDNQYAIDLAKAKSDQISEIIKVINNAKNGFSTNNARALFDALNNTITRDINGMNWINDVTSYNYVDKLAQVKLEAQALDDAFAKELAEAKVQRINDVIVWIGDRTQFISDEARKLVSDFIDSAISDINKFTTINQINNYLYQTRYRTLETTAIALDLELSNAKSNKISEMIALINNAKNEFKTNEAKALFDVLNKTMTEDINSLTTVDSVSKYEIVSKINSTKVEAKAIDNQYAIDLAKAKSDQISEIIKVINNAKNSFSTNNARALFDVLSNTITRDINGMDQINDVTSYNYANKLAQVKLEAQALDDAFAKELAEAKAQRINDVIVWIGDRTQFISDAARKLVSDFIDSAKSDINGLTTINQINNYLYQTSYRTMETTAIALDLELANAKVDRIKDILEWFEDRKQFVSEDSQKLVANFIDSVINDINGLTTINEITNYLYRTRFMELELVEARKERINDVIVWIGERTQFISDAARKLVNDFIDSAKNDINGLTTINQLDNYLYQTRYRQLEIEASLFDAELAEAKVERINGAISWIKGRSNYVSDAANKIVNDFMSMVNNEINGLTNLRDIEQYLYQTRFRNLEAELIALDEALAQAKVNMIANMITTTNREKGRYQTNAAKELFDKYIETGTTEINKFTSVEEVNKYSVSSKLVPIAAAAKVIDDKALADAKIQRINDVIIWISSRAVFTSSGLNSIVRVFIVDATRDINNLTTISAVAGYLYQAKYRTLEAELIAIEARYVLVLNQVKYEMETHINSHSSKEAKQLLTNLHNTFKRELSEFTTLAEINSYNILERLRVANQEAINLDIIANEHFRRTKEAKIIELNEEFRSNSWLFIRDIQIQHMARRQREGNATLEAIRDIDTLDKFDVRAYVQNAIREARALV